MYLDTETFSEVPIKHGTYRYCESAEVMIVTYAFGEDDPVQLWDVTSGEPMPADLEYMLLHEDNHDEEVVAHNAMFDRNALRLGNLKITIPIKRWRCTMVQAMAHALPGSLAKLCEILGIEDEEAKHDTGKQLIQLFCKPRPKNSKLRRATRHTHPEEWARFCEYAKSDIYAMRAARRKMPTWNYQGQELALWHLDQKINDRGFLVDEELAHAAVDAVAAAQKVLKARTVDMTNGAVESTTKRDQLLMHLLEEYGVELPNLQADTIERRIEDPDIPDALRELLKIRLQASTTSTSKYNALVRAVDSRGRLCGTLQFDGAGRTRRAAGRTVQPQNLMRPTLDHGTIELGIDAIKAGVADIVFDNVMEITGNAVRGCIIAPPGRKLVVADLANIEGRDTAWLAGENWKLQAFRDYDAGTGPDLYKLAYAKAFNISPADVDKEMRQIGKVKELMLGFGGGVGAFLTGAETYGIDLDNMAKRARPSIPPHAWGDAEEFLRWTKKQRRTTYGLSDEVFTVCDALKRMWREAHPMVSTLWRDVEDTARLAIQNPGTTFPCRKFKMRRDGNWLRIGLPSGRALCYPSPQVADDGQISYMGVNQYTRKWSRIKTFGGKLVENAAQSVARDVLYDAMPNVERAGYDIVLSVHDELITETPDSEEFNHEHLSSLIATNPSWCLDMPLAAAGFSAYRYRKD